MGFVDLEVVVDVECLVLTCVAGTLVIALGAEHHFP